MFEKLMHVFNTEESNGTNAQPVSTPVSRRSMPPPPLQYGISASVFYIHFFTFSVSFLLHFLVLLAIFVSSRLTQW